MCSQAFIKATILIGLCKSSPFAGVEAAVDSDPDQPVQPFTMAKSGEIKVEDFRVGMSAQVTFITPDSGRTRLNLEDGSGNIILHVNSRWEEKALVLNSKKNGSWGAEERPDGFDFRIGVPVTIRCEAAQDGINIIVNDKVIHCYKHRIAVSEVKEVKFTDQAENATKQTQLISLSIYY